MLAVVGRALLTRQEELLAAFLRREALKAELLLLSCFVACSEAVEREQAEITSTCSPGLAAPLDELEVCPNAVMWPFKTRLERLQNRRGATEWGVSLCWGRRFWPSAQYNPPFRSAPTPVGLALVCCVGARSTGTRLEQGFGTRWFVCGGGILGRLVLGFT